MVSLNSYLDGKTQKPKCQARICSQTPGCFKFIQQFKLILIHNLHLTKLGLVATVNL